MYYIYFYHNVHIFVWTVLPFNIIKGRIATNASKHLIDQVEERILLIDQSKNASKHS